MFIKNRTTRDAISNLKIAYDRVTRNDVLTNKENRNQYNIIDREDKRKQHSKNCEKERIKE